MTEVITLTKEEIKKITGDKYFESWYLIVKDIINSKEFQKRTYFPHHGNVNVFRHCVKVSYDSYKFSKNKKIDSRRCAIAGLLHDFYPYIWRKDIKEFLLEYDYYKKSWCKNKIL